MNAHGYLRFTRDVDLVLQLAPENIVAAFGALEEIAGRPQDKIDIDYLRNLADSGK